MGVGFAILNNISIILNIAQYNQCLFKITDENRMAI